MHTQRLCKVKHLFSLSPCLDFFQTIKNRIKVFLILLFPGSVMSNSQIIARQFLALSVQSLMEWNKNHFSISTHNFIFLASFFHSLNDCDSHLMWPQVICGTWVFVSVCLHDVFVSVFAHVPRGMLVHVCLFVHGGMGSNCQNWNVVFRCLEGSSGQNRRQGQAKN